MMNAKTMPALLIGALLIFSIVGFASMSSAAYGSGITKADLRMAKANARANAAIESSNTQDSKTSVELASEASTDLEDGDSNTNAQSATEIRTLVANVDNSATADQKASSQAHVSVGQGWATSSTSGKLARIVIVQRSFANNTNETIIGKGALHLNNEPVYALDLKSSTEDELTFDVRGRNVTGTLELNAETSLSGFTVWSGTLELNSGAEYDINLATLDRKVLNAAEKAGNRTEKEFDKELRANVTAEARAEQGNKLSAWGRLRSFLKF